MENLAEIKKNNCKIIAEIGINHNGDLNIAKKLIVIKIPKVVGFSEEKKILECEKPVAAKLRYWEK